MSGGELEGSARIESLGSEYGTEVGSSIEMSGGYVGSYVVISIGYGDGNDEESPLGDALGPGYGTS